MDHCSENIDLAADIIMAREDGSIKQLLAEFIIRCRQAEKPYDVEILIDAGLTPFELLENVETLFLNLPLPAGQLHLTGTRSGDATVMRSTSSDSPDTRRWSRIKLRRDTGGLAISRLPAPHSDCSNRLNFLGNR